MSTRKVLSISGRATELVLNSTPNAFELTDDKVSFLELSSLIEDSNGKMTELFALLLVK